MCVSGTWWKGVVSPGGAAPVVARAPAAARYCSSRGSRFSSRSAGTSVSVCPAMGVPLSGGKRSLIITQQNLKVLQTGQSPNHTHKVTLVVFDLPHAWLHYTGVEPLIVEPCMGYE